MNKENLYAVIIAGGRGKRFWPLSREARPKQLLALHGPQPLLRETVDRVLPLIPKERILVVTMQSHAQGVMDVLDDLPGENILVEPEGKNTAPALALAAAHLMERDPKAVMVVLPSDHVIGTPERMLMEVEAGAEIAVANGLIVTFGIRPTRPETGYGYIEVGGRLERSIFRVLSFKEKPNRKKAKDYVDSGHYLWNSGIFVFSCDLLMEKIRKFLPDLYEAWHRYRKTAKTDADLANYYASVESISIDYGVMEKCGEISAVISATFKWSDVGTWKAIDEIWEADEFDNRRNACDLVALSSRGNTVLSRKMVALLGVDNLIVVETDDAILVCKKERSQEIKTLVNEIEHKGLKEYL